jgi:hypothetical protein
VSRATFYDQFAGKTACFIAAFDACVDGDGESWSKTGKGNVKSIVDASPFPGIVVMPEGGKAGWHSDWAGHDPQPLGPDDRRRIAGRLRRPALNGWGAPRP